MLSDEESGELAGDALIKEVNRRIRLARSYWEAHNNLSCRTERDRAIVLYEKLSKEDKGQVPQALRVWLRYRSEKYFGEGRTAPARSSASRIASDADKRPAQRSSKGRKG
jgi:hypothetical protein